MLIKELKATFDQDATDFYRFTINEGQGIIGNIYVPKNKQIPNEVRIELRVKGAWKES